MGVKGGGEGMGGGMGGGMGFRGGWPALGRAPHPHPLGPAPLFRCPSLSTGMGGPTPPPWFECQGGTPPNRLCLLDAWQPCHSPPPPLGCTAHALRVPFVSPSGAVAPRALKRTQSQGRANGRAPRPPPPPPGMH